MKGEEMVKRIAKVDPNIIVADGFEEAILGTIQFIDKQRPPVAVYDREKCIQILVDRDGMDEYEAEEHFEFNVAGAYVGPRTPVFI